MICHIAALSNNNVIGNGGDMPWHLPEDLKFFKQKTLNHCIIMGRKTFESIGKPLPKRTNVVVTRNKNWSHEGCHAFSSIEEATAFCQEQTPNQDIFIIGGGELYKSTLPLANRLYLTRIDTTLQGDTTYPDNWQGDFKLISEEKHENEKYKFAFCEYERS